MALPDSDLSGWLTRSLEDHRFSRGERQDLAEMLTSEEQRAEVRRLAFQIARETLADQGTPSVLGWLEEVVKATRDPGPTSKVVQERAEVYFSPGDECLNAITRMFAYTRKVLDICVFTITDDRVSNALLEAHDRGVAIRIITDNNKAEDLGSDIARFEQARIPVRVDRSPYHMHHKFAIADGKTLLTGSYNWTRGAAHDNQENVIVCNDPRLLGPFATAFERLWESLA